ncbi:MAG: N-acetyltransferase [Fibrobacter sp.]|nr:N-acetyltransferase [Fibrobacter sp.]
MELIIKTAEPQDFFETENLTREVFWNLYMSGCEEHFLLNQIRRSDSYVRPLDLVALYRNKIIGHIISSKSWIIDTQESMFEILVVGPISVEGQFQMQGVGTKLINYSIAEAKKCGFKGMILFGSPDYYHRFGFKNAKEFNITTKDSQNFEEFMALEFHKGSLQGVSGKFFENDAYSIKKENVEIFDKKFPPKVKGTPKIKIG